MRASSFRLDRRSGPRLDLRLEWFVAVSAAVHIVFAVMALITIKQPSFELPSAYTVTLVSEPEARDVIKPVDGLTSPPVLPEGIAPPPAEKMIPDGKSIVPAVSKAEKAKPAVSNATPEETVDIKAKIDKIREKRDLAEALERIRQRAKVKEISVGKSEAQPLPKGLQAPPKTQGATGDDSQYNQYGGRLGAVIKSYWYFPGGKKGERETIVSITVMRNGTIKINRIEKSSGNALFDESALRAIKKASPFEPPPAEYEYSLRFADEDLK